MMLMAHDNVYRVGGAAERRAQNRCAMFIRRSPMTSRYRCEIGAQRLEAAHLKGRRRQQ